MCLIKEIKIYDDTENPYNTYYLYQAFGLAKERADWLSDYVLELICSGANKTIPEVIKHILNDNNLTDNEKVLALFYLGTLMDKPLRLVCLGYEEWKT